MIAPDMAFLINANVLSSNSLALNTCEEKKQTYIRHNSYSNVSRNPNGRLLYTGYSILHSSTQRKGEGGEKEGGGSSSGIKNNPGITYYTVTQLTLKATVMSFAMFSLETSEVQ
jgi:hypothetical protein